MDEFWANRIEGTGSDSWGRVPMTDREAREYRISQMVTPIPAPARWVRTRAFFQSQPWQVACLFIITACAFGFGFYLGGAA